MNEPIEARLRDHLAVVDRLPVQRFGCRRRRRSPSWRASSPAAANGGRYRVLRAPRGRQRRTLVEPVRCPDSRLVRHRWRGAFGSERARHGTSGHDGSRHDDSGHDSAWIGRRDPGPVERLGGDRR